MAADKSSGLWSRPDVTVMVSALRWQPALPDPPIRERDDLVAQGVRRRARSRAAANGKGETRPRPRGPCQSSALGAGPSRGFRGVVSRLSEFPVHAGPRRRLPVSMVMRSSARRLGSTESRRADVSRGGLTGPRVRRRERERIGTCAAQRGRMRLPMSLLLRRSCQAMVAGAQAPRAARTGSLTRARTRPCG